MPRIKRFQANLEITLRETDLLNLRKLSTSLDLSLAEVTRRAIRIGQKQLELQGVPGSPVTETLSEKR